MADVNFLDDRKYTPLHIALANGASLDIIKLLPEKNANVNALNHVRISPLHIAIQKKRFDSVELLIKNKANISEVLENSFDKSLLQLACSGWNQDIVTYLLKEGALDFEENFSQVLSSVEQSELTSHGFLRKQNDVILKILINAGIHDGLKPWEISTTLQKFVRKINNIDKLRTRMLLKLTKFPTPLIKITMGYLGGQ